MEQPREGQPTGKTVDKEMEAWLHLDNDIQTKHIMTDSDVVELILMDKNEEEEATALAENDYVTEVAVQSFQLQSS